jgi:capsular polysaccharide transport system ATP-binding protein
MIVVDNVHKRYMTPHGPGKWVLEGISLTIPPKCSIGLIGANGAGKSTLLRLIGGVDRPNKGRITRYWPQRHVDRTPEFKIRLPHPRP